MFESEQISRISYPIIKTMVFQIIAPLYDKLCFLKLVFGSGMKTLFLFFQKVYLSLENEEMADRYGGRGAKLFKIL